MSTPLHTHNSWLSEEMRVSHQSHGQMVSCGFGCLRGRSLLSLSPSVYLDISPVCRPVQIHHLVLHPLMFSCFSLGAPLLLSRFRLPLKPDGIPSRPKHQACSTRRYKRSRHSEAATIPQHIHTQSPDKNEHLINENFTFLSFWKIPDLCLFRLSHSHGPHKDLAGLQGSTRRALRSSLPPSSVQLSWYYIFDLGSSARSSPALLFQYPPNIARRFLAMT